MNKLNHLEKHVTKLIGEWFEGSAEAGAELCALLTTARYRRNVTTWWVVL